MNRIIKLLSLVLGALMIAAIAGCDPMPADLGQPNYKSSNVNPPPQKVYYFGDSLSAGARDGLLLHWHASGANAEVYANTIVGGTLFQDWAAAQTAVPSDGDVVLALGTNNISNEAVETGALEASTRGAFERLAHVQHVVWVNINTTGGDRRGAPFAARTRWLNNFVRMLVSTGQVTNVSIYDWAGASSGHVEYLQPDNVHYTSAGSGAYAWSLFQAGRVMVP